MAAQITPSKEHWNKFANIGIGVAFLIALALAGLAVVNEPTKPGAKSVPTYVQPPAQAQKRFMTN